MPTANSSRDIQMEAGTPTHVVEPRYVIEVGSAKNVLPPEIPVSSPRSTMSMPSVTMKPLRPNRTMSKPLNAPMRAPTSSTTGTARPGGTTCRPSPWVTDGSTMSQAAMPGARPNVDSSERSILPLIKTIVSASTTMEISDMLCRTLMMLSDCRKTGLTMKPTIATATMAGTRARSRKRAMAGSFRRGGVSIGEAAVVETMSDMAEIDSFHGGDQVVVTPAVGVFADDPAPEHHQDPVADAQVVQFVGDHEHSRPAAAHLVDDVEERLL